MQDRHLRCSRRKFLASAAAMTIAGGLEGRADQKSGGLSLGIHTRPPKLSLEGRKPIAVITTVYRPLSHAYHIGGRFVHGYVRNGQLHVPKHYVRSLYVDQRPENDLSRDLAKDFGVRVTRNIADALLDENGKLAVEGILIIGEHGNYPRNDKGQILYPRYEMMELVVEVLRKAGRVVPIFNDKHLSYSWERAKRMYDWSMELKAPFMAGSSLPVTWRRPDLELPLGSAIEDAVVAAYGPIEVYGFHALETLQVMLERRKGGESGLQAVTCLTGKEVWKAAEEGKFSWDLLDSALAQSESVNPGDVRVNSGQMAVLGHPQSPPTAFLLEYRDGLKAAVLLLNGHLRDFCFSAKIKGEPKPAACMFHLPPPPGARFFDCQVANIEKLLENHKSPYPAERTLLTSGALDAIMESHYRRGVRVETPQLDVRYAAPTDSGYFRGPMNG